MTDAAEQVVDPMVESYVSQVDTQQPQVPSPTEEPSGHDEKQVEAPTQTETAPETTGLPEESEEDKERIRDARYAGKLKQTQEDLQKEKEAREKAEANLSRLTEWAAQSPENYANALMAVQGWSKVDAEKYVETLKTQGYWQQSPANQPSQVPTQPQQANIDPFVAAEMVIERREATKALVSAFPELKEKTDKNNENFKKAYYLAQAWKSADPTIDLSEALITQYGQITRKTSDEILKARESGRIEGIAEARGLQIASANQPIAQTTKPVNYSLTAAEKSNARELGLTEEQYAARKAEKVTMVD